MDIVECLRGTTRVETYHKNLHVTFGGWPMGLAMSTVLLAENHHRHNQRRAERQIDRHPMIGHYDTWLIDLLQRLVIGNHGVVLYPHWSNTSDFRDTNKSFDMVALHGLDLHRAVESLCTNID